MKLATLREGGRDGTLLVVNRSGTRAIRVPEIAATLQQALEDWVAIGPQLDARYHAFSADDSAGFDLVAEALAAPLPRSYQWLDGSAYLSHVQRVRRARGADMPERLLSDPLMYQGCGDPLLGPRDPLYLADESWDLDFEAEIGVITDAVAPGVTPEWAAQHVRLLVLINDTSLRALIPDELAKGFGFLHGKPPSALAPLAVTPDELGEAWRNGKVDLPLSTYLNGELFGCPEAASGMQFDFHKLISHAAYTRPLTPGTLIGSGTVSNADVGRGFCCLVEKRAHEILEFGAARTHYLRYGDRVSIFMRDNTGNSIFGAIDQQVVPVG